MLIFHKGHNNTIQVYSVTVMTHVIALEDGQSSQVTSEPITPVCTPYMDQCRGTVQITFIFIDFRVCDFAFAFKTQNAPCVSRFKRVLFSDRFQFAF